MKYDFDEVKEAVTEWWEPFINEVQWNEFKNILKNRSASSE